MTGRVVKAPTKLRLLRCARCGETIYGRPCGAKVGDICNGQIPAEYVGPWWRRTLIRDCPGVFEAVGIISLA